MDTRSRYVDPAHPGAGVRWYDFVASTLIFTIAAIYYLRSSWHLDFGFIETALVSLCFLGALALGPASAVILAITWNFRARSAAVVRRIAVQACLLASLTVLLAPVGWVIEARSWSITAERADRVVLALARYRKTHGTYPSDLGALRAQTPGLPRPTMMDEFIYSREEDGEYVLEFPGTELFDMTWYESRTAKWFHR